MDLFKRLFGILILALFFSLLSILYKQCKTIIINTSFFKKTKSFFRRTYRLLYAKKTPDFVWDELIKYHKNSRWNFGQFDKEKRIECYFTVAEKTSARFNYTVEYERLALSAIILSSFDEERTNDVLVLASHFNGLPRFGVVKVNLKYNYVEYAYYGNTLAYSLFPYEIETDTETHFKIAEDCFWAFNNLLETGDDPVFVISELLQRNKEADNNKEN